MHAATEVFVLICAKEEWNKQKGRQVLMQDFKEERIFNNIGLTERNESQVKSLISLHVTSGCDTDNIGKVKCIFSKNVSSTKKFVSFESFDIFGFLKVLTEFKR